MIQPFQLLKKFWRRKSEPVDPKKDAMAWENAGKDNKADEDAQSKNRTQPDTNKKGQQTIKFAGLYRQLVPKGRLELPRPYRHMSLKHACLPIPPLRREARMFIPKAFFDCNRIFYSLAAFSTFSSRSGATSSVRYSDTVTSPGLAPFGRLTQAPSVTMTSTRASFLPRL